VAQLLRRRVFTAKQKEIWSEERAFLAGLPQVVKEAGATSKELR
jgi:hypothetical protein